MRNLIGKDGSSVLLPLTEATFTTLDGIASDPDKWVPLVKLAPQVQVSKGIVMGYPLRMPTALLLRHPQVEEANRCQTSQRDETRQVLVSVRGPLPPHIDLGNWGLFYLRLYTPEPLRCYRCQRYGHHKDNCSRAVTCGICSGGHWTERCLSLYKEKKVVRHRCANCGAAHHAWNPTCPVRLQRVYQDRERQVNWVQEQQRASATPAPPGTFVWGSQLRSSSPPTPRLHQPRPVPSGTFQEFPPLSNTVAAPSPPNTRPPPSAPRPEQTVGGTSQPSAPAMAVPVLSPAPTPPPTTQLSLPPGTFIMTAELLHTMVKDLTLMSATAFQQVSGVTIDMTAFEVVVDKLATKLVDQVLEKTQALSSHHCQQDVPPPKLTHLTHGEPLVTPVPSLRRTDPRMASVHPRPPPTSVSDGPASCASASGTAEGSAPNTLT